LKRNDLSPEVNFKIVSFDLIDERSESLGVREFITAFFREIYFPPQTIAK
jgi:hypothetical protein